LHGSPGLLLPMSAPSSGERALNTIKAAILTAAALLATPGRLPRVSMPDSIQGLLTSSSVLCPPHFLDRETEAMRWSCWSPAQVLDFIQRGAQRGSRFSAWAWGDACGLLAHTLQRTVQEMPQPWPKTTSQNPGGRSSLWDHGRQAAVSELLH
jgi:hypothetical protein